jgi:hypothetical protein
MEEFEKLVAESFQGDLLPGETSEMETITDSTSTKEESVEAEKTA